MTHPDTASAPRRPDRVAENAVLSCFTGVTAPAADPLPLPWDDEPATPMLHSAELNGRRDHERVSSRILVVEDEPAISDVVSTALRHHGHAITTADDGRRGRDLARSATST